jgi:hypothetical protein
MKSEAKSDIDKEDLICPITLQMFRDPVVAADGHTYERAAIVQWITEHGTSPITRQPLIIDELQSDDYLRNLATLRRTSSVSYNYDTNISHPALHRQSSTISYNYNINLDRPGHLRLQTTHNNNIISITTAEDHHMSCNNFCRQHRCVLITIAAVVVLVAGYIIYGLHFNTRDIVYSGEFFVRT